MCGVFVPKWSRNCSCVTVHFQDRKVTFYLLKDKGKKIALFGNYGINKCFQVPKPWRFIKAHSQNTQVNATDVINVGGAVA